MSASGTSIRHNPRIIKFLLFNSDRGTTEGYEFEKLIYYYKWQDNEPPNAPSTLSDMSDLSLDDCSLVQDQVKDIGLAEALIQFVTNFGAHEEIDSLHGLKSRLVLLEVEPSYWMICFISVPRSVIKTVGSNNDKEQHIIEYHDEDLNDSLVKILMHQIYDTFYLLNGSLQYIWSKCDDNIDKLRQICYQFFDWFLPSVKLTPINLLEVFGAIIYIPLDNLAFMQVQSFMNHVYCCKSGSHIKQSMFLFQDHLVTSSFDLKNTRTIYRYLVSVIIPEAVSSEMSESMKTKSKRTRYLKTGLKMHLRENMECLTMNLYRSFNGATVALFLSPDLTTSQSNEILATCDLFMSSRLPELAAKLRDTSVNINIVDKAALGGANSISDSNISNDMFKFVYFNGSNSAFKSNTGNTGILDHRKISENDFVKLIVDIDSDLKRCLNKNDSPEKSEFNAKNVIEILGKTTNESWLVAHQSDARTLFSFLNHKNANLVEANDSVISYLNKQFKNILFID